MVIEAGDEVANDAIQLLTVANFNGTCRLITALAANGFLEPEQLDGIHDAMTLPLDDPDWRDDSFVTGARDMLERVLAGAMKAVKTRA